MIDNIAIGSRFMQRIIEKSIEKAVFKSTGAKVKIRFTDTITVNTEDSRVKLHMSLDTEIDKEDVERLLESRG